MPTLPALLALADGSLFHGTSIGADGLTAGEVVFNTAMTGSRKSSLIRRKPTNRDADLSAHRQYRLQRR
jgi:hypothetical protein